MPGPVATNDDPIKGCPVIVVELTVCELLIVYVPIPPDPVTNSVIYVPGVIPEPVIYVPIARLPELILVTLSIVPDILPVTTAEEGAPTKVKSVVPTDKIV